MARCASPRPTSAPIRRACWSRTSAPTARSPRSSGCSRSRGSARASTRAARSARCRWAASRRARALSRRAPARSRRAPAGRRHERRARRRQPRRLPGARRRDRLRAAPLSRRGGGRHDVRRRLLARARREPVSADGTLVVDVGGGSTELVLGAAGGVAWSRSLQAGCVRMTERFLGEDVVDERSVAACTAGVDELLQVVPDEVVAATQRVDRRGRHRDDAGRDRPRRLRRRRRARRPHHARAGARAAGARLAALPLARAPRAFPAWSRRARP